MKDLKHYFADSVKACEANSESREVMKEPTSAKTSEEEAKIASPASARKKRGRVKIKISQNNSLGTVCDIVESNTDLVDKTPSPFAPRDAKSVEVAQDDTPKRSTSLPRKSSKVSLVKKVNKRASVQSESMDRSPDENDNKISTVDLKTGETNGVNGSEIFVERTANTENGDREESNAFQVLMTRKKLVQYNVPAPLTPQEEEAAAKVTEENRNKLKQNKEKLIAMADKKGYSKRKLEELEEAERIERRLEKRAKVFKQMDKKEGDEKNLGRRVSPGSLHNYFSKATPVQKEKELTAVSTLVVQAEVHSPDSAGVTKVKETQEAKMAAKEKEEIVNVLATANGTQVIEIESLPLNEVAPEQIQNNQRRSKKPRWSLRINLPCSVEKVEADSTVDNDDKTKVKRESKHRKSKAKITNYEENENSDREGSEAKSSKKKKCASNVQKTKGVTKVEAQSEVLAVEANIMPMQETVAPTSPELEIIDVKIDKSQTAEKLAPLFVKRQKPDPAVLEARRLFLHSVPAENENPRTERKATIVGVPLLPFPSISHVAQLDAESKTVTAYLKTKFPIRENRPFTPSFNLDEFKSVTGLQNVSKKSSNDSVEMTKENVEEVLAEIETRCPCASEIWKRISTTANGENTPRTSPKRKSKKRKSNDKKTETSDEKISHAGIWTHKYRPQSTEDIVGNEEAAEKLRKWLHGWKAPLRKEDNSSGDEFYSSDCSFASNFENNQVAVLLGPHGSGKTASVYAVAEELGYSIIEINASSKRTGKKILKELEEATKSHRIKKPDAISALTPLAKEKKAVSKNSLILVEDVDLIFEEDEGFISATCQLASNTKRPIVMTGRDTCLHLNRMAPQQHRIYYQTTVGSRVSALLELITLAESGYRLPRPCLDRLLQNGDLRKALLQLQYLLLSGEPRASEVPTNFHRSLWQDMRYCVYKPAIRATKKLSKKKLADGKKIAAQKEETVVTDLAKDLDGLSFLSTLIEIEDPALEVSTLKLEPSLSLDESTHGYSSAKNTSAEIARWLRDRIMSEKEATHSSDNSSQILRQLSMKKELNSGINFALSQVSPHTLDGRVLAVDYLPSLRTICRAEEGRASTNNKRGNRFFHYLQSLGLPFTSTRPNILAAACKMMREKSNSES